MKVEDIKRKLNKAKAKQWKMIHKAEEKIGKDTLCKVGAGAVGLLALIGGVVVWKAIKKKKNK